MKSFYTRMAALLPLFFFVAALQAQTYQPVVTSGSDGCTTVGTYNYSSIVNGKPSYTLSDFPELSIFWENGKWNLAFTPDSYYLFENTADTPLPPCGDWVDLFSCGTQTISGGCSSSCPTTTYSPVVTNTSGNSAIATTFSPGVGLYGGKPFWTGTPSGGGEGLQTLRWETANSRWEIVRVSTGAVRQFNTNVADLNMPCTGWQSNGFGPVITLSSLGVACGNIITPPLVPSVSIVSNDIDNSITAGTSVTFTATPTNGGTTPTYVWKKNDEILWGEEEGTYTDAALADGDIITCEMTSNEPCATPATATSNAITMTVVPICSTNPVVQNTNDSGEGSLRQAIMDACAGSTITFASPLFDAAQTITLTSGDLVINKNLTIQGPGANLLTVSGNNQSRVFTVNLPNNSTTVTISGLTVTGGNGTSSLASNNGDGGGILLKLGNLTLLNAIVSGNTATSTSGTDGGGITNRGNGSSALTLTNCIINGNDCNVSGGGIFNLGGPMTVSNSTISNNRAGLQGNNSGLGGGIENYYPMTLTNSTISGNSVMNTAGAHGGGIYTPTGTNSQIISCTITNNTASGTNSTGGLRLDYDDGGTLTVSNTIIAGNTGSSDATADINSTDSGVEFTSGGYNLIGDGTGGSGFTGTADLVGTSGSPINALLGPLADNGGPTPTHALLIGSPAIDNGNAFGLTADQRDVERPQDDPSLTNAADGTDIGAIEMACATPNAYALIGGGRSCDNGVSITLSGSELGVTYQLMKYGDDVGDPVEGTGDVLNFGDNFTEAGIYTVEARRTAWPCPADMTGCVIITPCFSGLGTVYCADDNTDYILTGSDAPNGTFEGPGITDNGDGTAIFNPSLAGSGGTVTYTVGNTSNRPDAATGSKSADAGGSVSTSQNVAVYLCGSAPSFTGLDAEYCDLDESVTLTGNYAPLGFFDGPGITDNGDGTATFDPSAAVGTGDVRYLLNVNLDNAWSSISAGDLHSMAIKTDGSLWAWGDNFIGQLGNGTNTNSDIPVQIDAANDWASVSTGRYHTLALKTDGTLWAWGNNSSGQLGNGTNGSNTDSNVPMQIGTNADWASISAGGYHSMAMKTDGTLWAWGDNFGGQLGNGSNTDSNVPMQVGTDVNWASIAAGEGHSLATKTDGTLWAWGLNNSGQLGTGTNTNVPIQVGTDTDWAKIAAGNRHGLATKANGTLWAWGNNKYGQLGNGSNTDSNTPVQVGTATDWASVLTGGYHNLALKTDGTLWAWGYNAEGQLGNGSTTDSNTPVQVGTDNNWVSTDAGAGHTMGLKTNGTLQTWGDNAKGQLGNGTTTPSNTPTNVVTAAAITAVTVNICLDFTGLDETYCAGTEPVTLTGNHAPEGTFSGSGITDNGDGTATFDPAAAGAGGTITYTYGNAWTNASAGAYHAMAVQANGSLWGWGYNEDYGQLGDGTYEDQYVPVLSDNGSNDWAKVSAGFYHSLGLKTDGTLWAWGYGGYGELGNGDNEDSNVPVQVGTDTDWAFIKAGYYVSYGIKTNGTLWAWGYSGYDLFGDGTTADRNIPVQIGTDTDWASVSNHGFRGANTLAVKTNGTLWAWGSNDNGQFGNGTTDASATPVQVGTDTDWAGADAGRYHSLGLKTNGTLWSWGNNEEGQLGNGTKDNSLEPIQVGTEMNWASAATGYYCSVATKTDGTLWGWGYNLDGELGNGTNDNTTVPVQSGTATNWTSVTASLEGFALGLQTNGSLWSWGYQAYGELGDGQEDVASNVPLRIGAVSFGKDVTVFTSPTGLAISNISASDCKNTTCTTDDTYTADVTVTFNTQPLSGTVSLSGDDLVGAAPSVDASTLNGTSYTFTGVILRADGNDIELTATLGDCSESAVLGKAPRCFFEPHVPANIELTSSTCSFINGTYVPNGTSNGAPAWIDPTNNNYIVWSGNAWVAGIFATNTSGSITEIPCTGWSDGCGISLSGGCGSLEGTAITPPCSITNISIANTGSCNDNGTNDAGDDYFTADVTVTFAYAPENQNLVLSQDGNELASVSSDDLLCTTTWTFTGVQMPANGQGVVLTAAFEGSSTKPAPGNATAARTDDVCTFTSEVLMTAPESCSCPLTGIAASNTSAADCKNTTCTTDDTFTADITVSFTAKPATGTLSLSGPTIVGTVPSVNVADIGATSYTFTGVTLKADGEEFELTATFSEGCAYTDDEVDYAPSCGAAEFTPINITVSGFGIFGPNGTYTPNGTLNGAPKWESVYGPGNFRIIWTGSRWEIQDAQGSGAPYAWAANTGGSGSITNLPCSGGWTDPLGVGAIDTEVVLSGGCGDLSAPAGPACDITGLSIGNMGSCNDNGTTTATDDYFVSGDVAVAFAYAPSSGDLVIKRGNTVLGTKPASELSCVTEWFFLNVQMSADGQPLDITAEFTGTSCTLTQNFGNAPASCSCVPTTAFTTCPATQSVNVDAGKCFATVNYAPEANGTPAPTYDYAFTGASNGFGGGPTLLAEFNAGVTNLKITATNDCGSVECNITVTVTDNQKPVITCPDNRTVNADQGQCSSIQTYMVTTTDNCSASTTQTSGQISGAAFPVGATINGFTATDAAGNTSACAFTITVVDNQKPVITCPDNRTVNADQGQCSSVQTYMVTTTDNCSASTTQTSGQISGAAFPVGTTTNGFTATDAAGNTSACAFTITVVDNQEPVITCPANIAKASSPNQCGSVTTYLVTATDNCTITSNIPLWGLPSGSVFPTGSTLVVWQATDVAGLTATCSFTVTVSDGQNLSIVCPANIARSTDANQCTALVTYANPTVSDNCPNWTLTRTSGPASGSVFSKGITMVNWQASDAGGNTAICGFTVTVTDAQAPTIACPANIVKGTDVGQCTALVTFANPGFTDNCTGATIVRTGGQASGTTFQKGTNTISWKVTDGAGLTSTCAFTVTVNDGQQPSVTCPPNLVKNADAGLCTAVVTYVIPTFTDNCTGGMVAIQSGLASGTAFQKGATTVIWRATDAAGLTKTCSFKVTVNDTQAPTITCPASQSLTTAAGTCASAPVNYANATFTDNCSGGSVSRTSGLASGSIFPKGASNVVFKATDAAANIALCSFTITVTDAQLPTINCPANIVAAGTVSNGVCSATVNYPSPIAADNCSGLTSFLLSGLASNSLFPVGVTTNTWRAIDQTGASSTCSFIVTVGCGTSPEGTSYEERGRENEEMGTRKIAPRLSLNLAPNPATTTVLVSVDGLGEKGGDLRMFDAQGRMVYEASTVNGQQSTVNLLNLSAGIYFVTLRSEGTVVTKRLVKVE